MLISHQQAHFPLWHHPASQTVREVSVVTISLSSHWGIGPKQIHLVRFALRARTYAPLIEMRTCLSNRLFVTGSPMDLLLQLSPTVLAFLAGPMHIVAWLNIIGEYTNVSYTLG